MFKIFRRVSSRGFLLPVFAFSALLTSATPAMAQDATLSGRVFDAADGETPIYPVDVDLLDPVTGSVTGILATNQPDGSYLIEDIPPGQYKVIFNAYGDANGYADELYDEIFCDDGACDRAALGDVLDLVAGANALDEELAMEVSPGFTVSGTVTAQVGGAPLEGVQVDFQRITEGFAGSAFTDANGDYSFAVPADDDYYLLLPKYGIPSPYLPEVWPGIYCDFQVCDVFATGSPVNVSGADVSGIDFALDAGFVMTGTVLDAADSSPIEGVEVCVHRTDSSWTGSCGTSDVNGDYQTVGLPAGSDYVSFANADSQGYKQQMYDGLDCPAENCDFSSGTTIELGNPGNANDINFNLSSVDSPSNTCGSGDLIMAGGFEALPQYTINFTSDTNVVITEAGQQAQFSVEFLDENGVPLDTSSLEWCLEDETNLSVASAGTNATVDSTGFALGSVDLVVRDPRTSIYATASILFADLQPDATYIDSEDVIDNGGGGDTVILERNAYTESIQPGDVLVSGDKAGLLVRVLSVSLTSDQVILTVEAAKITDAFVNLDINGSTVAQNVSVNYEGTTSQLTVKTELENGEVATTQVDIDSLECVTEDKRAFGLKLVGGSIDWDIETKLFRAFKIEDSTVQEFSFYSTQSLVITAQTGSLDFSSVLAGEVTCEIPLPRYKTPTLPYAAFSFGLGVQPKVGIKVGGGIDGPSFSLAGPQGEATDQVTVGFRYTVGGGWETIANHSRKAKVDLFTADFDTEIDFSLEASAFGGVGFELIVNAGKDVLSWELASVEFVEVVSDISLNAEFKSPFDSMDKDYTGPKWDISGNVTGEFKAEFTNGALFDLLEALDVPTALPISGNVFDPVKVELLHSPRIFFFKQTCSPDCEMLPDPGDRVTFAMQTDNLEDEGQIEYLASVNNQEYLVALVADEVSTGGSVIDWIPDEADLEGVYQLHPRLQVDPLSILFPYAPELPEKPERESIIIGDIPILMVEKPGDGEGTVTSDIGGIDCGETCVAAFEEGDLVTLTAVPAPGSVFLYWEFGDACSFGSNPVCEVRMDFTTSVKPVFSRPLGDPEFADPNLQACVDQAILSFGYTTFYEFDYLYCDRSGVRDISGISQLTGLRRLQINSNQFADLSELAGLQFLYELSAGGNQISDLSPLASLSALEDLRLDFNDISDISPLAALTGLEVLTLRNNQISDISAIASMESLQGLALQGNLIADISPLSQFLQFQNIVDLTDNRVSNLTPLASLTHLQVLLLNDNLIEDLGPLEGLTQLVRIEIRDNEIKNIAPLSGLTQLSVLDFDGNKIENVGPLSNLNQLTVLNLHSNQVQNVGPLAGLTQMFYLDLRDNLMSAISSLTTLVNLQTFDVSANLGRISCAQQALFDWVASYSSDGWQDLDGDGFYDFPEERCD
jgi:internalin A